MWGEGRVTRLQRRHAWLGTGPGDGDANLGDPRGRWWPAGCCGTSRSDRTEGHACGDVAAGQAPRGLVCVVRRGNGEGWRLAPRVGRAGRSQARAHRCGTHAVRRGCADRAAALRGAWERCRQVTHTGRRVVRLVKGWQVGFTACAAVRSSAVLPSVLGRGCGPAPGLLQRLRGALSIWGAEVAARSPTVGGITSCVRFFSAAVGVLLTVFGNGGLGDVCQCRWRTCVRLRHNRVRSSFLQHIFNFFRLRLSERKSWPTPGL